MRLCVVVIRNNVLAEVVPCENEKRAKQVFFDKCESILSNWDVYSEG
jgi:hypothetical protein